MEEWRGEISETDASEPNLFEEALKSVFHLTSQICGSFIEALSETGLEINNTSSAFLLKQKSSFS